MRLEVGEFESPIGGITVAVCDGALRALSFSDKWASRRAALERQGATWSAHPDPGEIIGRLARYFGGDLDALSSIAVAPHGTPFQQRVWRALRTVPVGHTVSYGELARSIGMPSAVRAVGAANGANPIGIVIPCHRVIGADGRLVGYGGGLARKRWLLEHEGACPAGLRWAAAQSATNVADRATEPSRLAQRL